MKAGWEAKPLGEVCQFLNGLWKGEKPPFRNVGVIRNTNFTKEGTLDDADIAYLDVEARQFEKRRLQFGDIILEKSGGGPKQAVGRVVLFDKTEGDFSFSNFTSALRVLDPEMLDFRFLHKFLHWSYLSGVTEGMQSHSTGIRNLDGNAYKAITICFPGMSEQQRLVGILDEAFEAIATAKDNAEINLQNSRALFESRLETVFSQRGPGWVERAVGSFCEIRHGFAFDGADFSSHVPDGNPLVITPGNFTEDGRLVFNERNTKRFRGSPPAGYSFETNDLVVVMTDLSSKMKILGKPAFVETENVLHNQRIGRVVFFDDSIDKRLLYYYMMTKRYLSSIKASATGTMVKHTAPKRILSTLIRLPIDLKAQREIIVKLDALRDETQRLESIYQRKLAALDELKNSLLHQAFAGELNSSEPAVIPISAATGERTQKAERGLTTTDLHAGILALAYRAHERAGTLPYFGHVKAEKIAHMVEARLGIDLGRTPVKDAAGPNDYPHLMKVEHRARHAGFFDFRRDGSRYKVLPLRGFDTLVERTWQDLGERYEDVVQLIDLMVKMDTERAEIVTTVYAAWNNLLLGGLPATDDEIVRAAREDWHPDKLKIERNRFFSAIAWMRDQGLTPAGTGSRVADKPASAKPARKRR
jgi:type I restriction enzyme S subunit